MDSVSTPRAGAGRLCRKGSDCGAVDSCATLWELLCLFSRCPFPMHVISYP